MQSIQPDVFAIADDGQCELLGGYCTSSGRYHFPLQDCCPYTGALDIEPRPLPKTGTLWGWTAVTAAPPGYEGTVPYGFGVVELDAIGLRVITRLIESDPAVLTFGDRMTLVTDEVAPGVGVWAFSRIAS